MKGVKLFSALFLLKTGIEIWLCEGHIGNLVRSHDLLGLYTVTKRH